MHMKISSTKWGPFCPGGDELTLVVLNVVQLVRITALEWWNFCIHDDVIKWKHFPRNWPYVRGIHRSPVNSTHKGQWRRALMFSLICSRINGCVNNGEAGDLIRYRVHCDAIVMWKVPHAPFNGTFVNGHSIPAANLCDACCWQRKTEVNDRKLREAQSIAHVGAIHRSCYHEAFNVKMLLTRLEYGRKVWSL